MPTLSQKNSGHQELQLAFKCTVRGLTPSYRIPANISDVIFGKIKFLDIILILTCIEMSSDKQSTLSDILEQLPCCSGMKLLWFFMLVPTDNTNKCECNEKPLE
jgi:hypothetical protein